MSILLKNFKPRQIFDAYRVLVAVQARQGHFYPDFIPGPYPKTEEERKEAAKKYNLLPEEYEPYPEKEIPVGDYPKLPFESVDSKNPDYPWDWPEIRKDFNEPVPREIMMLLPEAITTSRRKVSLKKGICLFSLGIGASLLFLFIINQGEFVYPICEKQFPTPGVTHYTFEHISEEEMKKLMVEERLKECLENYKQALED